MSQLRKWAKRIGLGLVALVVLLILGVALGPLLVSTEPASGTKDPRDLATESSPFIEVPSGEPDHSLLLHYLSTGTEDARPQRAPWLFLHGFTFNAFTFEPLLAHLGEQRLAVAYDQPPYGLSAKPDASKRGGQNPYTLDAATDHLLSLMNALEQQEAILVGNSSGAVIALEVARQAPERVAGVVLINPMVGLERPTLPRWLANLPQMRRLSLLLGRWLGESTSLLERSYHDPEAISAERKAKMTLHTGVAGWDRAWGQLIHRSLTEALAVQGPLPEIDVPAMVLIGEQDQVIRPRHSRQVAEALPAAERRELPGCGHVPQEECPQATAQALQRWQDENGL